ncbi:MAG: hypothetical protein M1834_002852 [Cirrosporium novae-zelandiae]|nr:MAG: hypothetical protein M1834_002852 [Cirrosporium novae-zelandiae]
MSYTPMQGYYAPPTHSPQPGYNRPPPGPPGQYPPRGYQQYPQQQQQQQQQGFGAPPPGQYPPQQNYPPQQQNYPQQQFGQPPQSYPQQYGAQPQSYPPPQQYGAPQYGMQQPYSAPTPPSPGYDSRQVPMPYPIDSAAEELRKAMKGFGTNETVLIQALVRPDPVQMAAIRAAYLRRHNRDLEKDVEKETSGYFQKGLLSLVRGPLLQDVYNLDKALKGAGTKESLLDDVILGRTNADMHAIKEAYRLKIGRPLEKDIADDLSLKTEMLFKMVLSAQRAEESAPIIPQSIDQDVDRLHKAMHGAGGTNQLEVCDIISSRSSGQLRAISGRYHEKFHKDLDKTIEKSFSGHMESALLELLRAGADPAMKDAMALEAAMKGIGTKDYLLVQRLVRAHWNRDHMQMVKGAYRHRYKKELAERVRGETSGDFGKLCLALVG